MNCGHDSLMNPSQRHHQKLWRAPIAIALYLGLPWGAGLSSADESLLRSLREVENTFSIGSSGALDGSELPAAIDRIAQRLADRGSVRPRPETVIVLNRVMFSDLQIRPSQDLKDPDNLIPSHVLDRKQGYCVGIAALYLLIAERLDLPMYAVATPSHLVPALRRRDHAHQHRDSAGRS